MNGQPFNRQAKAGVNGACYTQTRTLFVKTQTKRTMEKDNQKPFSSQAEAAVNGRNRETDKGTGHVVLRRMKTQQIQVCIGSGNRFIVSPKPEPTKHATQVRTMVRQDA